MYEEATTEHIVKLGHLQDAGNLEPLALFAGQIAGAIQDIPSAGELVQRMVREAEATLERLRHLQ